MRRKFMDVSRFLKKPQGHFFLLGPRGTGKSWWTRKTFADALRVDLLDAATLRELAARKNNCRISCEPMAGFE